MASTADKTKPYIPHNSVKQDGWSTDTEATATCFCGTVQLTLVSPNTDPADFSIFHSKV